MLNTTDSLVTCPHCEGLGEYTDTDSVGRGPMQFPCFECDRTGLVTPEKAAELYAWIYNGNGLPALPANDIVDDLDLLSVPVAVSDGATTVPLPMESMRSVVEGGRR